VHMRVELIRLHRELGTTFIYVTHDQVEAMTMGERLAVLDHGALQQVGPPQEVYDRPANLFVAQFIGSPAMNFFDAEPATLDGEQGLRAVDAFFKLPSALNAAVKQMGATKVVVGIRPEHLVPQGGEIESIAGRLDGKVDVVESLGSEQHVMVALPHGSLVVRLGSHVPVAPGDALALGVAAEHLHLFDAQTTQRIGP